MWLRYSRADTQSASITRRLLHGDSGVPSRSRSAAGERGSAGGERLQRGVRIAERGGVHWPAGSHQRLDRVTDVPDVDVHSCQHAPAIPDPERDEFPPVDIAAEDDLVVAVGL